MTDSRPAVFLSYASEDVEVAARICAALRAAGLEVWFDQSELRGGDAWDASIRRQIKTCALFIPVISHHSHDRAEGYFRLEWKLAVDRSHLIAPDKAFLVPVVIDHTRDDDSRVPDRFRELQWTSLPGGETPPAFVERIARLLAPEETNASGAPARPAPATVVAPTPPSRAAPSSETAPRSRLRLAFLAAAAIALGALAYYANGRLLAKPHAASAGVAATPAPQSALPGPPTVTEKSIAVLPFLDMSEKHDQEYFSDGLTEELLDQLAQVPDLRVPARTSSFYFKGKQATIAEIARALGVANVLEGSVRKAGSTIRVTAQLIRADSGYHLWSSSYDRDVKDIFKVQDQIAAAVVEALKAKLLPPPRLLSARRSENSEAYDQYLLGRQYLARDNNDDYHRAADEFRKAIALDPQYAAAWAGLAHSLYWVGDQEQTLVATLAVRQQARTAADKAVTLQPDLAYGYVVRAIVRADDPDIAGAAEDLRHALALEPGNAEVLLHYGVMAQIPFGALPEGIDVLRRATTIDPLNARVWSYLGLALQFAGDLEGARAYLSRSLEISPVQTYAPVQLGTTLLLQGRAAEAQAAFARTTGEAFRPYGAALSDFALGHVSEAQRNLDALISGFAETAAYQVAEVYAWRGDRDHAIHWLQRARDQKDGGLLFLKVDPLLRQLHGDPRYEAMLVAAKLK
jgi:TolB-like protein/Flp pilus assembly protein TadD